MPRTPLRAIAIAAAALSLTSSVLVAVPAHATGVALDMPSSALADENLNIRVTGLAPNSTVTLTAEMLDDLGRPWSSQASFTANGSGVVHVNDSAPLSGSSYSGVDKMGLFYSMTLVGEDNRAEFGFNKFSANDTTYTFKVVVGGTTAVTHTFTQKFMGTGVTRQVIDDPSGVKGVLYMPAGPVPTGGHPGLVSITGSDGGLGLVNEARSALLASHGYATLVLPYFNYPGLPATLKNIPLEYFDAARVWLAGLADVHDTRIGISGASRGGEGALLIASHFPGFRAVVASTPSGVVWPGNLSGLEDADPAWTLGGQPVTFVDDSGSRPALDALLTANQGTTNIVDMSAWFLDAYNAAPNTAAAEIPVEDINGAVLMVMGDQDQIWPASTLAGVAKRRLNQNNQPVESHVYDNTGHIVLVPNQPTSYDHYFQPAPYNVYIGMGGTPAGNHDANRRAWTKTLTFLDANLKNLTP